MGIKDEFDTAIAGIKARITAAEEANLRPGKVVTVQLGDDTGISWFPCASVLLLAVEKGYSETMQFYGVVRNENDLLIVHKKIGERTAQNKLHYENSNTELGQYYSSEGYFVEHLEPFLGKEEANFLRSALRYHLEKINKLPQSVAYCLR